LFLIGRFLKNFFSSPLISHNLWKVYAVPKILYGLEVMPIKKKEMEQMEIMQRKLLRQLQGLSNQVANTAVCANWSGTNIHYYLFLLYNIYKAHI
jgi:hypothetical protein